MAPGLHICNPRFYSRQYNQYGWIKVNLRYDQTQVRQKNMTDYEMMEIHLEYPIFVIGSADGGSVPLIDYEGCSCCLVYKQKELAELYIEQAAEATGNVYHANPIGTPTEFYKGLSLLKQQGCTDVIWDATYVPSVCKVVAIEDLLVVISSDPPASEEGSSPRASS